MGIDNITDELFKLRDLKYKQFHSRLVPNIDADSIIGVRVPVLRKFYKEISDREEFMSHLPHKYYEENIIHGLIVSDIRDYDACIRALDAFLPFVDNWGTCDSIRPKCFVKNKDKLILKIKQWLSSDDTYTVRFAVEMLMVHYLDDEFDAAYLGWAAGVKSDEYYIKMMVAWYFATALAKKWDEVIGFIENKNLTPWVHNKTIQKARESYRISSDKKAYLLSLKLII